MKKVPTDVELRYTWAYVPDSAVSLVVGAIYAHAIEDDDLELFHLGKLATDLVKAHLLRHFAGEDNLPGDAMILRCFVGGVLLLERGDEALRLVGGA